MAEKDLHVDYTDYQDLSEYKDSWYRSGQASAIRFLSQNAKNLLLVHEPDGEASVRLLERQTGIWHSHEGQFGDLVSVQARSWFANIGDALVAKETGVTMRNVREGEAYVRFMASPAGWEQTRKSISAAAVYLGKRKRNRLGIQECRVEELDENLNFLGCLNGVVDLRTGELLSPEEGRKALVTRKISTAYNAAAEHEDVDKLFAYQPEEIKNYLLAALGNALRMPVHNRAYAIQTPTGAGKTTLMTAIFTLLDGVAGAFQADAIKMTDGNRRGGLEPEKKPFADYRIVYTDELQGIRIDAGRAKQLWGFGHITLREPYKSAETRRLIAHCFLLSNSLPRFNLADAAVARRLRIIPMQAIPISLRDAMQSSRLEEIGQVGVWLEENVVRDINGFLSGTDLWNMLRYGMVGDRWEQVDSVEGLSRVRVTKLFRELYDQPTSVQQKINGKNTRGWRGIRLRRAEDDEEVCCVSCGVWAVAADMRDDKCSDITSCNERVIAMNLGE